MSDVRPDWFGTPKAAAAAVLGAVGRKGRGAVADLYERAHGLGYGPMTVTDRVLAEEWLLTRGEVWRVLEALDAAGLARLEKAPPGARRPSVVTVFPPRLRAERSQTRSQNPSQNDPPPPPPMPEPEPEPEPDAAHEPEPSRAEESRARRPDQTRPEEEQQTVVGAALPNGAFEEAAALFGQVVNLAVGRRPSAGPERNSRAGIALRKAVQRDRAKVLDAMRYVAEGEGEHAEFLRSRGTGLETILRHLDEYAERWRNPVRPQQRARGSPSARGSPDDGVLDELLAERTGRRPTPRGDVIDAD